MIVIAIIAAIAIPKLVSARLSVNETAAIATFRDVVSAEAQFQPSAKADTDNDGTGEYGGFIELSGSSVGRVPTSLHPAALSGAPNTDAAFKAADAGKDHRGGRHRHPREPGRNVEADSLELAASTDRK